jgi:hypothetical protein
MSIDDSDPVLQALIAEAETDPEVIGLILTGSRGAGATHPESDYDVCFLVTDAAYDRYEREARHPLRGAALDPEHKNDIWHERPRRFYQAELPAWEIAGFAEGRVLLDKTGETAAALAAFTIMTEAQARIEAANRYDDYLNCLYRSLKAWRRGNELGGRLQAAESAFALLQLLFALERRHRPYHDRLWLHLDSLASQGWQPGELQAILLDLISTGNPQRQQAIAWQVIALMRERGYEDVYIAWNGQIETILAWIFSSAQPSVAASSNPQEES